MTPARRAAFNQRLAEIYRDGVRAGWPAIEQHARARGREWRTWSAWSPSGDGLRCWS